MRRGASLSRSTGRTSASTTTSAGSSLSPGRSTSMPVTAPKPICCSRSRLQADPGQAGGGDWDAARRGPWADLAEFEKNHSVKYGHPVLLPLVAVLQFLRQLTG